MSSDALMARVLYLLYEPAHSGQAVHVASLAWAFKAGNRYNPIVACPSGDAVTLKWLQQAGITVYPMRMRKFGNLIPMIELTRLLKRESIQILHVHGQEAGIWGRVAARLAQVPIVVYTPHTIETTKEPLRPFYYLLERALASYTDMVISVNEVDRLKLIDLGIVPPDRVVTIHNGIDAQRYDLRIDSIRKREELEVGTTSFLIAQIGRLNQQKGLRCLIQAASLVLEKYPKALFLLIGEGPLEGELRREVEELGLSQSVRFLGWRDDVPEILACVDLFVLASLWEGLPYTLLEAMAAGLPVVATDVGGCREVVLDGETGLLVPPRAPEALAQAIMMLLSERNLLQGMAEKGRERVAEHFSIEVMIEKTEAVYNALIEFKVASSKCGLKTVRT